MNRRDFIRKVAVTGAAVGLGGLGTSCGGGGGGGSDGPPPVDPMAERAKDPRPNIVYVFSDEHRSTSWSGGGEARVITPTLRRMADEGVVFTNCVSNYPLCSPHRASLLTGRFPQLHSVGQNVGAIGQGLPTTEPSIAALLRARGYATGYVGKWHLYPFAAGTTSFLVPPGPDRQGFDDYWRACHNYDQRFMTRTYDDDGRDIVLPGYAPTAQTDLALEFVDRYAHKPFCLFLSWQPPHPPFDEYPDPHWELYRDIPLDVRPNVPRELDPQKVLAEHRAYYAHVTALDAELGRILDRLDALGIGDNTVVVYSSDHGELLASQGTYGKNRPWEESLLVPFIARWPKGIPAGLRVDAPLGTVDVAPTLLGLVGAAVPAAMQGWNLAPTLRGEAQSVPDSTLIQGTIPNQGEVWSGVRTARHTYAKRGIAGNMRPWLLYDNAADPYQTRNLAADETFAATRLDLEGLLATWEAYAAQDPAAG